MGIPTLDTMCGRFALDLDWDNVARWLDVPGSGVVRADLPAPSYNVAPKQTIAMVAAGRDGVRHLEGARWSLVPPWSPSRDLPYPTYNARVESIASKPTFAASTRSMRAIIPASGYYEWKGGATGRPYYFHMDDGKPLAMAGLFSWWRPALPSSPRTRAADDVRHAQAVPWQLTVTIVTCPAVDGPSSVHHRMPLLVPDGMVDAWLDRSVEGEPLLGPLRKAGAGLSRTLRFHEVAPLPDPADGAAGGPELIVPLRRPQAGTLF